MLAAALSELIIMPLGHPLRSVNQLVKAVVKNNKNTFSHVADSEWGIDEFPPQSCDHGTSKWTIKSL
jgi:AAA+ superfamily predicted ATPase